MANIVKLSILTLALLFFNVEAHKDPHMVDGRKAIVHLFEWKWDDIADECERFLGPMGYGGVQVSPANENAVLAPASFDKNVWRPWYERYQAVSYKLLTRSGNEAQFKSMVERCNNVGVRIYVDVVINHMTGGLGKSNGTGGSYFDSDKLDYPGVPYSSLDFHSCEKCGTGSCNIEDFGIPNQVRYCRLLGLRDLDQSKEYVRQKIADFLNHLTSVGVAGFRVDAAKHMLPDDLANIYTRLNNLNTKWFAADAKPFIYHEVIDMGSDPIPASQYVGLGRVTEFKFGLHLGRVFRRQDGLTFLENFGQPWAMMNDGDALVFIDNHDNQRGHGGGGFSLILTHNIARLYKMATAFMLAWPYGVPRIMSSFAFNLDWQGPPSDEYNNTLTVKVNDDLTCSDGWICEHRWRQIYNMVRLGRYAEDAGVNDWWAGHTHQIAFSRGDRVFVAINNEDFHLKATIQTGLPPGQYCDIISGNKENGNCTGRIITVNGDRKVDLDVSHEWEDPMIAIYAESKIN